ncbi:MAG TPA: hypothetical protein VL754_08285, partial [Verrucomicrobiae bacterium]|nr:hypothetical protein [Verrucomicrobiae bacterium]
MSGKPRFWLPSIADVVFVCVFAIAVFKGGNELLGDADTGYHIRTGEYILRTHTVPTHDIFSFISPPLPWFAHEWLSEVIMAWVHQIGGLTAVVIFFSIAIALCYALLFKFVEALPCNLLFGLLIVALTITSSWLHWLARPHIFSLVLTVLWYRILDDYQNAARNRLLFLPALMLLWVNLHGGFILGLLLIVIYLAGNLAMFLFASGQDATQARKKVNKLAIALVACIAVCLVNPRGYLVLLFPFETLSNKFVTANVIEFWSPNFHDPLPYKYLLLVAIGVLVLSRSVGLIEWVLLLLLTYMSLYSQRFIPLFAIIVTPILVRGSQAILDRLSDRLREFFAFRDRNLRENNAMATGYLWPVVAVAAVFALTASGKVHFGFDPTIKPVAAVEFLKKEHIEGKVFNDDEFGDYMIYAASPQYKVFFDGRSDMYGEVWGDQYIAIARLHPNWEEV